VQVVVVWVLWMAFMLFIQQLGCRGELLRQSAYPSDRVVFKAEFSLNSESLKERAEKRRELKPAWVERRTAEAGSSAKRHHCCASALQHSTTFRLCPPIILTRELPTRGNNG
jgi:hypothetical protein